MVSFFNSSKNFVIVILQSLVEMASAKTSRSQMLSNIPSKIHKASLSL